MRQISKYRLAWAGPGSPWIPDQGEMMFRVVAIVIAVANGFEISDITADEVRELLFLTSGWTRTVDFWGL